MLFCLIKMCDKTIDQHAVLDM